MQELIERIRERLAQASYANEAAISIGVVTPLLAALGWDTADPEQLVPEYAIPQRGRVDHALLGLGKRPAVFIEVKGLGLAATGDRQLFEYAFHHGVPLCLLTDGREWSFYLPSGQGSYDDRRLYRLQIDDRDSQACEVVLRRYLERARIRSGAAQEDAQRDHREAAGQREAEGVLGRAWAELVGSAEDALLELVAEKTEMLCGYRPRFEAVASFLQRLILKGDSTVAQQERMVLPSLSDAGNSMALAQPRRPGGGDREISYTIFGERRSCSNASDALVDVLQAIARRNPDKLTDVAKLVRGRTRSLIARTVNEINPLRPDLARAQPIALGWLVGLTISNRTKMAIIRAACSVYEIRMPDQLQIAFPNAN